MISFEAYAERVRDLVRYLHEDEFTPSFIVDEFVEGIDDEWIRELYEQQESPRYAANRLANP